MSGFPPPGFGYGPRQGMPGRPPFGGPGQGFSGGPPPPGRFPPGPGGPMMGMGPPPGASVMPRLGGGGMMPPMPGGPGMLRMPPRPGVSPGPAALGPKSTTIYVGKIAASLDDDVMTKLLEACGSIKHWKPVKDPSNNQPKGFGFVEYEDAEGVLRALRLLNGVKIDGQELLLKSNTNTQKYLAAYEQHRDQLRRQKQQEKEAGGDKEGEEKKPEGEEMDEAALDEANDNAALEIIMSIASEREAAAAARNANSDAVNEVLTGVGFRPSDSGSLPPPPLESHPSGASSDHRDRDHRDHRGPQGEGGRYRGDDHRRAPAEVDDYHRERELERQFEKERERQRREEVQRKRDADRVFGQALQRWEMHERELLTRREREKDRAKDLERERQRAIKYDLEKPDTDDEMEPWERPTLRGSRRMEERRKRRHREQEEDRLDRDKEQQEREEAAREEEAAPGSKRSKLDPMEVDSDQQQQQQGEADISKDDAILQAMLAAAKNPTSSSTPPRAALPEGAASPVTPPDDSKPAAAQAGPLPAAAAGPAPAGLGGPSAPLARPAARGLAFGKPGKPVLNALFGEEEEETTTKRKLVPIRYSEEELQAVQDHSEAVAAAAAGAATAAAAATGDEVENKAALRRIMDTIPVTTEGVYGYPIKWAHYNAPSQAKVSKWVGKKVVEMLGTEEPSLSEFVMELLAKHTPAAKMEKEAEEILEDAAAGFTLKLYRMVIYETEKAALGIKD